MFTSYYSKPQFYYPYVIFLFTLYGLVQISIWIFKPKDEHEIHGLNDEEKILIKCEVFLKKGKDLKRKYMWAYLLAKASMWAKAPYTFILFSTCHGFSVGQIGILYLIDAIFSLLSGPFTGILADTLGRKKIALLYPLNTIIVLLMRMSGSIQLAYLAQIMSGVVGNVLSTAYESWLNFEMIKIYGNHKTYIQHFRKNIFSKILFWDSVISLFVTIVGAIIYNFFGIYVALSLSIFLAAISVFSILTLWSENRPNFNYSTGIFESFREACKLLHKPEIFFLCVVDSFYNSSIQIIVFIWTPVLQSTINSKYINPAMIYLLMVISLLIHNKTLELMHRVARFDFFILTVIYTLIFMMNWLLIYFIDDFNVRLICLAGSGGLMNPVISYLRSIILVEQYRALLMNLFRVPLNAILILMLILANYFNSFQICFLVGTILIIPLLSSMYLLYYHNTIIISKTECELEPNEQTDLKIVN